MNNLGTIFSNAMNVRGFSVRSLEAEITNRYGSNKRISRGLIGDYKLGKRAPTYERAIMLADVLGVNREEFLIATFKMKRQTRDEAEWSRFTDFCFKLEIEIDRNRVK